MLALAANIADGEGDRAVVFVDLDGFKDVNDRYSHAVGDEVLSVVAQRLQGAVREGDVVGRIGGDEFLVVCPEIGSAEQALGLAARMAKAQRRELSLPIGAIPLQVSVGVAFSSGGSIDAETLVAMADHAMYESKRERRGRPKLADAMPSEDTQTDTPAITAGRGAAATTRRRARNGDRRGAVAAAGAEAPESVIEQAVHAAREMLGMEMAYVADVRGGLQDYRALAGEIASFGVEAGVAIPLEGTYCEKMLDGSIGNVVHDARNDPATRGLEITGKARIGAYVGVPVTLSDGRLYGTFCCLSHEVEPALRARDVQFMHVLARLIGDQISREENEEHARGLALRASNVTALLAALHARDGYTEGHCQEVVSLALSVGRELGLDERQLLDLESLALLHDIGKIGIADAVLRKPDQLSKEEWAEMQRHPDIGADLVAAMPSLSYLAPMIRAEHERWDGRGYPKGLREEEIPLLSRIVFVCDAYHAMTSDRPYRRALAHRVALGEIEGNAGSQFCPSSAAALTDVLKKKRARQAPAKGRRPAKVRSRANAKQPAR